MRRKEKKRGDRQQHGEAKVSITPSLDLGVQLITPNLQLGMELITPIVARHAAPGKQ